MAKPIPKNKSTRCNTRRRNTTAHSSRLRISQHRESRQEPARRPAHIPSRSRTGTPLREGPGGQRRAPAVCRAGGATAVRPRVPRARVTHGVAAGAGPRLPGPGRLIPFAHQTRPGCGQCGAACVNAVWGDDGGQRSRRALL